jgi:hypothetical protein
MKKLLIAGMALMILSTASFAKIGIGYDGYNSAVSVKYWAEKFGFQGMFRMDYNGLATNGDSATQTDNMVLDFTAKFLFPILKAEKIQLNGVLGIGIVNATGVGYVKDCSKMDIGFLLGLSPEYYVLPNLSFETTFGIGGTMFGATKIGDDELKDDKMEFNTLGNNLSISTGVAFHYYFPETAAAAEPEATE